jgi:dsRNA-specific ribonuclease
MDEKKVKQKIDQIFKLYEEDIDEKAMKKDILNLAQEVFKEGMKEKIEVSGVIGDWNWEEFRANLVIGFISCKNEKDFLTLFERIVNGIGTPKDLAKQREKLGIHPFNENDLDQIEKFEKKK